MMYVDNIYNDVIETLRLVREINNHIQEDSMLNSISRYIRDTEDNETLQLYRIARYIENNNYGTRRDIYDS